MNGIPGRILNTGIDSQTLVNIELNYNKNS